MTKIIQLDELHPHPRNPRLSIREDIVEQIAAQIQMCGFDEAHALIVRPLVSGGYEIISGHTRCRAAKRAGLESVPCWVREMSDDDAYMALILHNAQGELTPLEIGIHALGSGLSGSEYARRVGMAQQNLADRICAARVATKSTGYPVTADIADKWQRLCAIHAAPEWLWPALVSALVEHDWTVEEVRKQVQRFKSVDAPPAWADDQRVAAAAVSGAIKTANIKEFYSLVERCEANLIKNEVEAGRLREGLLRKLIETKPGALSEVEKVCLEIEQEQTKLREEENRSRHEKEAAAERIAGLRKNVSLKEWKELREEERAALLEVDDDATGHTSGFNRQENNSIEWAQWSWNPVTGCLHSCPYCYARDIANSARMAKAYPHGFEPAFRPSSLLAPRHTRVPDQARTDARYRNVFTCSMADLFGRWVPKEWIEAVLNEIRNAPQWNFLCLTKFPKRMAEFDIPSNAWMGTSVDLQARAGNAEAAFANVKSGVRWLSIEPMLEPLRFEHLDRFDWVVIGGASSSSETPEWHPPFEWIVDLVSQARAAGTKVYFKTNLLKKRILELPFDAPIPQENGAAPGVFKYLGKKSPE